jgi:hypothetical protein
MHKAPHRSAAFAFQCCSDIKDDHDTHNGEQSFVTLRLSKSRSQELSFDKKMPIQRITSVFHYFRRRIKEDEERLVDKYDVRTQRVCQRAFNEIEGSKLLHAW